MSIPTISTQQRAHMMNLLNKLHGRYGWTWDRIGAAVGARHSEIHRWRNSTIGTVAYAKYAPRLEAKVVQVDKMANARAARGNGSPVHAPVKALTPTHTNGAGSPLQPAKHARFLLTALAQLSPEGRDELCRLAFEMMLEG